MSRRSSRSCRRRLRQHRTPPFESPTCGTSVQAGVTLASKRTRGIRERPRHRRPPPRGSAKKPPTGRQPRAAPGYTTDRAGPLRHGRGSAPARKAGAPSHYRRPITRISKAAEMMSEARSSSSWTVRWTTWRFRARTAMAKPARSTRDACGTSQQPWSTRRRPPRDAAAEHAATDTYPKTIALDDLMRLARVSARDGSRVDIAQLLPLLPRRRTPPSPPLPRAAPPSTDFAAWLRFASALGGDCVIGMLTSA